MEHKVKYCAECKSPLPMEAQFCMKCGARQLDDLCADDSKSQIFGMKYSEGRRLDRNAVILYMMNVRDLEVTKHYLEEKIKNEKLASDRSINSLLEPGYRMYGRKPGYASGYTKNMWLYWILALLLTAFGIYAATRNFGFDTVGVIESFLKDNKKYINIAGWIIAVIGCAWMIGDLYFTVKNVKQRLAYRRECREIDQYNEDLEKQMPERRDEADRMEKEWNLRSDFLHSELDKAGDLLESLYDMNILPVQYRNVAAASYIYDYMSHSDAELESTLEHEQIKNGIVRIEKKLDAVFPRLEGVVYENRCLRHDSNEDHTNLSDKYRRVLKNLTADEQDEKVRIQYEKLADIDSAVTEFFNNADYIKE